MVPDAANDIEWITLFQDPLPDPQRSQVILETVWTNTELKLAADVVRSNKIDAYVWSSMVRECDRTLIGPVELRSIQSRTRAHVIHHAKKNVAKLYKFDQNCSSQYIRGHIRWPLTKDRFTCRGAQRKVRISLGERVPDVKDLTVIRNSAFVFGQRK